jgi:DNA mismatch repair protein MutS2
MRTLLAREARSPMGRERALQIEPFTDPTAIRRAIEQTSQARRAFTQAGAPPLDAFPDPRAALDRCRLPGSVLDGVELVLIGALLDAVPPLAAYARGVAAVAPLITGLGGSLPRLADLAQALRRALADDGSLTDDASPRLRQLRRDLRDRRRRIVSDLERQLNGADADRLFADRYVTVRHGRYVLPVRAEARGRVRGIVHDRSQSGQTLFIEPADVVDANNDLVQLGREEEQETVRILAELTDAVRAEIVQLDGLVDTVAAFDAVFARAGLADRMDATPPVIDDHRTVNLREARHPLLLAQTWTDPTRTVVPADIELGPERPLLVITGPNAGGKTIALKTLALHAWLAQTGCHVPAREGSRLPVFTGVHAIIGDDQSVAENLSTFSAFVKQAREILAASDDRSLVLLDELGAGTDPDEGAALAQAILEELAERGALVVATTHLEPLKAFASTHPRARNASVEFDTATLAPTFRLIYDRPGPSYALTIAARLGLAPALIERAQSHRSAHTARLSELLQWLDEHTRCEAERTLAIERREQEAAARLTAAREAEAAAQARAREIVERAQREASGMIGDVRRTVSAELDRLKRADRSRRDVQQSRQRLGEVAARVAAAAGEVVPPSPAELAALVPGSAVAAEHLGVRGELLSVAGGTATVRSGSITVRVPLTALRAVAHGDGGHQAGRRPARAGFVTRPTGAAVDGERSFPRELLLLGKTTDEARDLVEQYLDDAFMAGLDAVRLVHGKGTGALRKTVRDLLAAHPLVDSFRDGEPSEGGTGATVAALKVS